MTVHTADAKPRPWRPCWPGRRPPFRRGGAIEKLARESGGASRQTWSFDALVNGERRALDPAPRSAAARPGEGAGRARAIDRPRPRHRVPRAGRRPSSGRARARALFELTPADGLGEAYVMHRMGGTAIARKLLRDPPYEKARGRIAGQLGEILARIHAVDPATLPPLARRAGGRPDGDPRRSLDHWAMRSRCSSWPVLARPPQARADRPAGAGPWRLPHRQLPGRRRRA